VCALLPWLLILVPWFVFKHRELDILQFGDATAISLGVNIQKERIKLIVAAVALTGAAVSVTGGIGFLGLIAPHVAKRLGFKKHWQLLPIAALIGHHWCALLFIFIIKGIYMITNSMYHCCTCCFYYVLMVLKISQAKALLKFI
jgi:ABC-type Fe3+-siderophore transport system permease subunit